MHWLLIWHLVTHFWARHDIFFTKFGLYSDWVRWNLHHFRHIHGIHRWHGWAALWAWVNVHG